VLLYLTTTFIHRVCCNWVTFARNAIQLQLGRGASPHRLAFMAGATEFVVRRWCVTRSKDGAISESTQMPRPSKRSGGRHPKKCQGANHDAVAVLARQFYVAFGVQSVSAKVRCCLDIGEPRLPTIGALPCWIVAEPSQPDGHRIGILTYHKVVRSLGLATACVSSMLVPLVLSTYANRFWGETAPCARLATAAAQPRDARNARRKPMPAMAPRCRFR
jgi:hypothetical protein